MPSWESSSASLFSAVSSSPGLSVLVSWESGESLGVGVLVSESLGLGDELLVDDDPDPGFDVADEEGFEVLEFDGFGFEDFEDEGLGLGFDVLVGLGLGFGFGADGTAGLTRGGGLLPALLFCEKDNPIQEPLAGVCEVTESFWTNPHEPLVAVKNAQKASAGGVSMHFSRSWPGFPSTRQTKA